LEPDRNGFFGKSARLERANFMSLENCNSNTSESATDSIPSIIAPSEQVWRNSVDLDKFGTIDREQIREQLAALGYKAGDTVYLRAFFPDSDPRKTTDAGRKAEAKNLDQVVAHATKFQSEGRGIYLVVNGGGHADKDVTNGRAIFYEHDNLDKAVQIELWKDKGLPEPTFQVNTGGKSIHSYWVFAEPIALEKWRLLQAELLEFADADRSIKNPSRVMRLAGAWHTSGNQSLIISSSGKRYKYEELREAIPTPQAPEPTLFQPKKPQQANPFPTGNIPSKYEDIALPVPISVPLENCLAKASRDLLNGVSEGGRNLSGHKLACDLIGTANYLQAIGQSFDGDAENLFQAFGSCCTPPLDNGELQSIWKSAQGSNPSPACKSEGVENCIKGFYWNNIKPSFVPSRNMPAKAQKLPLKEAAELARSILNSQRDELSANIELEAIRERAGISDYAWENKIIKPLKRDMDAERFKLELLGLLQMEDAVERYRQISLLAPKYSMSAGTIKEAMAAMKSRTQTTEVKILTFDDLLAAESEALEWQVQELLPVGETVLFVALPKVGKSKAAVDLAFCVATGESRFLGREVKQGKVLMVCPDASQQSLKHEMLKRGFRSGDSKNIRIMPRWSIDQMSVLEQQLEDFRPDLVVIDSLKKITAGKEISENSAEFADNIIALNDMLGRYRASGVLIHHASKSNEAVGVAKARGSTAIVGACWGVWDLERIPKPDPNNKKKMISDPKCPKRIFTATSRDAEGLSLNIEFNPENNSFDFISEVGLDEADAQQQQSYGERILAVLRKNPGPISGPELMELMGAGKEQRGSIYSALGRMESKRLISNKPALGDKRYNLYFLPNFEQTGTLSTVPFKTEISLPPPPHTPTVPDAEYVSESYTQYGFDNSQHNIQQIVSTYSACDSSEIAESIATSGVDPIVSTYPLSQGGRGVEVELSSTTDTPVNAGLAQSELNEDELDLLQMIQSALTEPGPESARQVVADILPILKELCGSGGASREKIWAVLTAAEQARFKSLLADSTPPQVSERSAAPIAYGDNQTLAQPLLQTPEPSPENAPASPQPAEITPEDAEKMRDIALIWWPEYYPEQLQALIVQMYGWQSPGTCYEAATIRAWLEGEDALVQQRIGALMDLRKG
jgi:hypothetical protein